MTAARPADRDLADPEPARLAGSIARRLRQLGGIGQDPRGGWSRIGFTRAEREAHELFASWAGEIGLEVGHDPVGNTYARRPGSGPTLMTGSHLDTVPGGGNFDGAAGVVAAVEAASLLASEPLEHPLTLVCFACEEGARFAAPCLGSRVATGQLDRAGLQALRDSGGTSAFQAALDCGLRPQEAEDAVWEPGSVAAYLELHIEQGRVLQESGRPIGIVDTIAGSTRAEITLTGRSDHSGATPMGLRRDALVAAAEVIAHVERAARRSRTAVATVGHLEVWPNVVTIIPGQVRLTLDVRDVDPLRQRELADDVLEQAARVASRRGLEVAVRPLHDQSPFVLHYRVREQLARAAAEAGASYRVMASGAGHDAGYVSAVAPAGMLFVPSRDGISHSRDEWSDVEDIALGAVVLARALRHLDRAPGASGA
jgi:allantoate deiminase